MIFSRRAIQVRLEALRSVLDGKVVDVLARRLNRPGKDRLAAMWEVVVFHALSLHGKLGSELSLASGRRPDVHFTRDDLQVTADVTVVSDEGLDDANPYREFNDAIEAAKAKLGLPVGGSNLQISSARRQTKRGTRTSLLLPPRKKIRTFVKNEIIPRLREQIALGAAVLKITFETDEVAFSLTIDPGRSPYNSGRYASYDIPTIRDQNPLYNALKSKAEQLRGAPGVVGVIVGDADTETLSRSRRSGYGLAAEQVVQEFFRQFSSIGFVLLLTAVKKMETAQIRGRPRHRMQTALFQRPHMPSELGPLVQALVGEMPTPIRTPVNAALRSREDGYDVGFHGGFSLSKGTVRMSSRELLEILAGRRKIIDEGAKYLDGIAGHPQKTGELHQAFMRKLLEGRLPIKIDVVKGGVDEEDDWIDFEFGDPDPAISPFR
jgi:hypothetical protein